MLLIMILSALWMGSRIDNMQTSDASVQDGWISPVGLAIARRLALPQSLLAVLVLTNQHVQIITRVSSGYPLWYWWLASRFYDRPFVRLAKWDILLEWIIRWMVLYALIQAGLFAAFLPPA